MELNESSRGLTKGEARKRLLLNGYNELPSQTKHSWWAIFFEVLREPMLAILAAACLLYLFMGDRGDALMLSFFVCLIIGITFYQQRKTERTLEALRNLSSPRALVIRDGAQIRIPGREVVVGDLVLVREGDRVPADALVLEQTNLMVNEAMLTGESLAVSKTASLPDSDLKNSQPGGDNTPFLYSGTLVTQGWGLARVGAIGSKTQMGLIGVSLASVKEVVTPLRREMRQLVIELSVFGVVCCFLVVIWYIASSGQWLQGFLAGLTLSMSLLPEEIPVVLMIFFTLGAWRIAKRNVLTRNQAAIETLGAATVLCVDKTGTLTQNKMQLQTLANDSQSCELAEFAATQAPLPEVFYTLLEYALLASQRDPFDPLEIEIKRAGDQFLSKTDHLHYDWELVRAYPLQGTLLALTHVWQSPARSSYVIAAKGAPEAIASLCHFSPSQIETLLSDMKPLLENGLRLIAVAKAEFITGNLPLRQHDFDFSFCGLLGFADPIRPQVPAAVKVCQEAGIRICMVTGDYPGTAQHVARQVGLANPEEFLTGQDLERLSKSELDAKMARVNIFARIMPEQKLHIVQALEAKKYIVAMTGDGVNDAPALKAAHIGIAMGQRGTDVAREAADLVLLDDNFSSIVGAVRAGRGIFDNLRKAVAYIFSVHIPIAGMAMLPIAFGMPVILMPAHIAFLEMVIDPACTTVYEAEPPEKNIMSRPPRNLKNKLFGRQVATTSIFEGLGALAINFWVLCRALAGGATPDEARSVTFLSIVLVNLALIVSNLSLSKSFVKAFLNGNRALFAVMLGTLAALAAIFALPFLRGLFHFAPLGASDIQFALLAMFAGLLWFELVKRVNSSLFSNP